VERLRNKVHAVLVGEAMMRADNPTAFIANLFNLPAPGAGLGAGGGTTADSEDLRNKDGRRGDRGADASVDFFGFVFVPGSKRVVSVDDARWIASVLNERSPPLDQTETETEMGMGIAPWFTTHA
jgi:anthranilate synthase / indole-3-glycerol phosphate synthase / phosphoribosylanthranilate isomerase